jgi:hypothetical protein
MLHQVAVVVVHTLIPKIPLDKQVVQVVVLTAILAVQVLDFLDKEITGVPVVAVLMLDAAAVVQAALVATVVVLLVQVELAGQFQSLGQQLLTPQVALVEHPVVQQVVLLVLQTLATVAVAEQLVRASAATVVQA